MSKPIPIHKKGRVVLVSPRTFAQNMMDPELRMQRGLQNYAKNTPYSAKPKDPRKGK